MSNSRLLERGGRWLRSFLTTQRILILSFAFLILVCTIILMLPAAVHGATLSFIDALFTATSAACVTGLVVVDTGTKFTALGQLAILLTIQVGGLGIMTFSTALLYLVAGRFSLTNREVLQETISQGPTPDLWALVKTVFVATLIIEFIGAVLLSIRFVFDMEVGPAIYSGIFHAISAFCNAGFALFPDSVIAYQSDLVLNLSLMILVVLGGIGFPVIYELYSMRRAHHTRLSLHARLVLVTTAILIAGGALLILLLESKNADEQLPWQAKLLTSLFQSVTTRTAGFNSMDIGSLSNPTLFIMIILMFVGASPASCGGGIKTTTFAVIMAQIKARFYGREDTNLYFRRIPSASISKAITLAFFSTAIIILWTVLLLITELAGLSHRESRGLFLELLFEVTSAFATVGLSTGITSTLSPLGRLLIVLLMFIGRLGSLTIALAVSQHDRKNFRYAEEEVMIG